MTEETQAPTPPAPVTVPPELRLALSAKYRNYGPEGIGWRIDPDGSIWVNKHAWRKVGRTTREGTRLVGAPVTLASRGHKITLYMDNESVERAKLLGHGNLSLGVRRALKASVV